jgi:hypothetical protein
VVPIPRGRRGPGPKAVGATGRCPGSGPATERSQSLTRRKCPRVRSRQPRRPHGAHTSGPRRRGPPHPNTSTGCDKLPTDQTFARSLSTERRPTSATADTARLRPARAQTYTREALRTERLPAAAAADTTRPRSERLPGRRSVRPGHFYAPEALHGQDAFQRTKRPTRPGCPTRRSQPLAARCRGQAGQVSWWAWTNGRNRSSTIDSTRSDSSGLRFMTRSWRMRSNGIESTAGGIRSRSISPRSWARR